MARDRRMIGFARSDKPEVQKELFDSCWPIVWSTAYAITGNKTLAEDAAQVAVVNVFRALDRLEPGRPLEPWVRRIAANAALSELRKQKRQPVLVPEPELYRDAKLTTEVAPASDLVDAVARLGEERRVVVALYYWLDYSIAEIADLLHVPQGTVASRRARALKELRLRMEDQPHARHA